MSQDEIREFDEWAATYDESVRSPQGFPFAGYDAVLDRVVFLAAAEPSHHVLDLGVGTGNLSRRFAHLGCQVSGIDFSPRMLERAREKVPGARLVEVDLRGPWPRELPGPFDRIVSSYLLHHFNLAEKISLLRRLVHTRLAPGGRVVVGDICFPTRKALQKVKKEAGDAWEDEEYWIATETIQECDRAGLHVHHTQVSECGGVFVFWPEPER